MSQNEPDAALAPTTRRIRIADDADAVVAYQTGRTLATDLGFSSVEREAVAIAIAEVAHNILRYASAGEVLLEAVAEAGRQGLRVCALDDGPGIPDVELALSDGYTTGDGLGLGLPGARRLMDEFELTSRAGQGTTVEMTKWHRMRSAGP